MQLFLNVNIYLLLIDLLEEPKGESEQAVTLVHLQSVRDSQVWAKPNSWVGDLV